ncbi:MAG: cytochrome c biogenesis heme-transporting ATPase CcmA [Gammaproteobacteria bacterium]
MDGLVCIRDTNVLFEKLSFCVQSGQVLVIEGKNGSGKTSLLRILTGIRQQDEGKVTWNGDDITDLATGYRQVMAYMGHQDGIKQELTALENLQLAHIYGKISDNSLDEVLEITGLAAQADVYASNLSAGQRRRLAIARLLLTDCRLWILDEPLTTLDTSGIKLFENLLKQHVADGGIAVLSSHHDINLEGANIIRMSL